MEKLHFTQSINAPKEKVWSTLWDDATYRQWTSAFSPSSYAESDWNEGSKILFLGDNRSGMVSKIETKRLNEFMSFKHLGEVKNGVEDTESEAIKAWAGAFENYTLNEVGGKTELVVDIDVNEEYKDMFMGMFPKALEQVKLLAEQ